MIRLVELHDCDFDWMAGDGSGRDHRDRDGGLTLPPGGVDAPPVLAIVRDMTRSLHQAGCRASWMVVSGDEVVGLCSFRRPPADGEVEIGYGIAPARQGSGHATAAVAAMIRAARERPDVRTLTAETALANPASGRVLEKNGFAQVGSRIDAEDGPLACWALAV